MNKGFPEILASSSLGYAGHFGLGVFVPVS